MVIVRLISYVHALIHDSVLHGKIVLCYRVLYRIKVWPIKYSVRLCKIPLIRPRKSLYIHIELDFPAIQKSQNKDP